MKIKIQANDTVIISKDDGSKCEYTGSEIAAAIETSRGVLKEFNGIRLGSTVWHIDNGRPAEAVVVGCSYAGSSIHYCQLFDIRDVETRHVRKVPPIYLHTSRHEAVIFARNYARGQLLDNTPDRRHYLTIFEEMTVELANEASK